jgi:hypothetical protein
MYQFSRGIYRELAQDISGPKPNGRDRTHTSDISNHVRVLQACEAAVERLATDRHYFARPTRSLFSDIRMYFPMHEQERVYTVVAFYLGCAQRFLTQNPLAGHEVTGEPLQCRATRRKGTACQRMPLPHNRYCPSHQHLAETEQPEPLAA